MIKRALFTLLLIGPAFTGSVFARGKGYTSGHVTVGEYQVCASGAYGGCQGGGE